MFICKSNNDTNPIEIFKEWSKLQDKQNIEMSIVKSASPYWTTKQIKFFYKLIFRNYADREWVREYVRLILNEICTKKNSFITDNQIIALVNFVLQNAAHTFTILLLQEIVVPSKKEKALKEHTIGNVIPGLYLVDPIISSVDINQDDSKTLSFDPNYLVSTFLASINNVLTQIKLIFENNNMQNPQYLEKTFQYLEYISTTLTINIL